MIEDCPEGQTLVYDDHVKAFVCRRLPKNSPPPREWIPLPETEPKGYCE